MANVLLRLVVQRLISASKTVLIVLNSFKVNT